jgi:hypothetical protein
MSGTPEADDAPHTPQDEEPASEDDDLSRLGERERREVLKWVGENLTEVRRVVSGERVLHWILWMALVIGLLAHVAGYALRKSVTTEPLGLLGDLLYALGHVLWTGVVLVMFLQILPEAKRRQYKKALDAYERAQLDAARGEADQASSEGGDPTTSERSR